MATKHPSTNCEICNTTMLEWAISPTDTLLKCPACNHIKRDLSICNANCRESAWGGSGFFDKIRNYLTYKHLLRIIPKNDNPTKHAFEIGFGHGDILTRFVQNGWNVQGVDFNMLQIGVNEMLKIKGDLTFDKIENVTMDNDKFMVIYGIHLIEHLEEPREVLTKCYDALKQDGIIFFITPNADSKGLSIFKSSWWNLEDPTHIRFFSEQSIRTLLEQIGFKNIEINISLWDSVTLEINSLLRKINKNSKQKNGALTSMLTTLIDIVLLPLAMLIRLVCPKMSASFMITASK